MAEAAIELSSLEPEVARGESIRKRATVAELVASFEQCEREIRQAFETINAASARLNDLFSGDHRSVWVQDRWGKVNFDAPDDVMREVRRSVWRALVYDLELERIMSVRAWKELKKQLDDDDPPEINAETVGSMMRSLHTQLPSMLEEAVREVFEFLRPWRTTHKTNKRFEIGRRVIREGICDRFWADRECPRVNYHYVPELNALERVFQSLDGRGTVGKLHQSELQTAIEKTPFGERGETRYFAFRCFRKGTLHIEFLRLDLLKKLNQIAGGKRLKDGGA